MYNSADCNCVSELNKRAFIRSKRMLYLLVNLCCAALYFSVRSVLLFSSKAIKGELNGSCQLRNLYLAPPTGAVPENYFTLPSFMPKHVSIRQGKFLTLKSMACS